MVFTEVKASLLPDLKQFSLPMKTLVQHNIKTSKQIQTTYPGMIQD